MTSFLDNCGGGPGSSTRDRFADVLAAAATGVAALREAPVFGLTDDEVTELVGLAERASAVVAAVQGRLVAEAEARDLAKRTGSTSTSAWLRHALRISGGAAARITRTARAVDGDRVALTRDAWATGRLTGEQAHVIGAAINGLSATLDPDRVRVAQLDLIGQAGQFGLDELRRLANRLVEVIDPEGADEVLAERLAAEERRALQQATVRFTPRGDGTTSVSARLPDLQADMFKKMLDAIGSPRRRSAQDGPHTIPGHPEQLALSEATGHIVACPQASGVPALGITAGETAIGCGCRSDAVEAGPGSSPVLYPDGDHCPPVPYPNRLGRALMELIEHLPAAALPDAGRVNASIVVTIDRQQLTDGVGIATLDTGGEVTAGQARRLACNAGLLPLVLGGESAVLDLGRAQRLFSPPQRVVLAHRDGGCVWRGCSRPPAWCEAHHLQFWRDNGPTDIDNGALVCGFHHRLLHGGEWEARLAHDGIVEIIPPARIDPDRTPIRHERFTGRRYTADPPTGPPRHTG